MPELPEVETIARNLAKGDEQTPSVLGQKQSQVRYFGQRLLLNRIF